MLIPVLMKLFISFPYLFKTKKTLRRGCRCLTTGHTRYLIWMKILMMKGLLFWRKVVWVKALMTGFTASCIPNYLRDQDMQKGCPLEKTASSVISIQMQSGGFIKTGTGPT